MQPRPLIHVLAHSCGVEWNGWDRNNVANKAKSSHYLTLKKYLLSGSEDIYLLSVLEMHPISSVPLGVHVKRALGIA